MVIIIYSKFVKIIFKIFNISFKRFFHFFKARWAWNCRLNKVLKILFIKLVFKLSESLLFTLSGHGKSITFIMKTAGNSLSPSKIYL